MGRSTQENQELISSEAAQWLLRLEEDTSVNTHAEFVGWLKHSPRHMDEFLMVEAAFRTVHQFRPRKPVDFDALVRETSAEIVPLKLGSLNSGAASETSSPLLPGLRIRWKAVAGIAAAALLILGSLILVRYGFHAQTYSTAVGEQRAFKLTDGSMLHLNTQSRVEVHYSKRAREVRLLQGEALFVVKQEAARPFQVRTDAARVQAVGTAFNVYRRADKSTLVSVIEGRVKIIPDHSPAPAQPPLPLAAGEEANVRTNGEIARRAVADVEQTLAWRQRRLVFRMSPLREVVAEFNRYNDDTRLEVADPRVAERRITGTFDADAPEALVKFLQEDRSLELEESSGKVLIR